MDVVFDGVLIKNFKGIKELYVKFSDNTTIFGQNATGKTTIVDAVTYCLFGTDSLGNSKFEIRPLDKNGNKIHNIVISVCLFLRIDGKKTELKRELSENWVKKRGSENPVLQGNVGSYEIDGYPRNEKDYKEYINCVVSDDLFKMLTNPTYFPNMPWKDQRATIMKFASEISDIELAAEDNRFDILIDELGKAPSTDDIKNKYTKSLNELKKKQVELPVRIDEVNKTKVDIDVAELELQRNALKEQIAENKAKQDDVSKQFEEYSKISNEIMHLKFDLNDMRRKANEDNANLCRDIQDKIDDKRVLVNKVKKTISDCECEISYSNNAIESYSKELNKIREEWKAEHERVFDDASLVCSYCGQEYPTDKKEQLKAEFESYKAEALALITTKGNMTKANLDKEKETLARLEKELSEHKESLAMLNTAITDLERELSALPIEIDVTGTEEYKAMLSQIAEKEQTLSQMNDADSIKRQLRDELDTLQAQFTDTEKQIALSQRNVEIDERIEELQAEQRDVAQKIADVEKMLFMLDDFIKYKLDKISDSINSQFELVNFVLFRTQINGGIAETCECQYKGVPFGSLNSAARIQCGLDIIRTLQKMYGVYVPVFIDNRESCTNIPIMDCQVISLVVSPTDKDLRIEVE